MGDLRLTYHDGVLTVVTPDGVHASSDYELLAGRKASAELRAAELEQRLREAGIDPDG